jgi:hypothetical protein
VTNVARFFLPGLIVLVAVLIAATDSLVSPRVLASHDGGMDEMTLDMNPGSEPANTSTSLGSIEFCARMNENDILDADEDGIDALYVDVVTGLV